MKSSIRGAIWIAIAVPALYQIGLMITAISGRITYPYDLEWMEGGMLHHALRIRAGQGIYVPPSIEFIPYLYTPLYPALLAWLGKWFGISYVLGRVVSVLSLAGIAITAFASMVGRGWKSQRVGEPIPPLTDPAPAGVERWCGAGLALGLFAAVYPYVDGWYDLVRSDTVFLFTVTAGIAALPYLATSGNGVSGHARVGLGAAIFVLAFFCKQTGIFYVALGTGIVVVVNWRRCATFVAIAGVLGLGISAVLNATSDGWYWTYISKIHRAHDFSMDRFWRSFGYILWHFPTLTVVIGIALVAVAITAAAHKPVPKSARTFALWATAFAVSVVVGAVGWGTQFAHFNAYMPAFLHGALAGGLAIAVIAGCAKAWCDDVRLVHGVAMSAAIALAYPCVATRWDPSQWVPASADAEAGDRLIQRLARLEGDIWMPSHPWYAVLAGKSPHVHRMGIKDVTTRQTRTVGGLQEALASHRFSAIVMDERDLFLELPQLSATYELAQRLPETERPYLYSGARIRPQTIWLPRTSAHHGTVAK